MELYWLKWRSHNLRRNTKEITCHLFLWCLHVRVCVCIWVINGGLLCAALNRCRRLNPSLTRFILSPLSAVTGTIRKTLVVQPNQWQRVWSLSSISIATVSKTWSYTGCTAPGFNASLCLWGHSPQIKMVIVTLYKQLWHSCCLVSVSPLSYRVISQKISISTEFVPYITLFSYL